MIDFVPSPYGPREFDCTGDPRHWPCGTGFEAPVVPVVYESAPEAAARLSAHEQRLRSAARNRGMLPGATRGRPASGRLATMLPSTQWDLAWAGYLADRRVSGSRERAA